MPISRKHVAVTVPLGDSMVAKAKEAVIQLEEARKEDAQAVWTNEDVLQGCEMSGGITNGLVLIKVDRAARDAALSNESADGNASVVERSDIDARKRLVRVYGVGSEELINREAELVVVDALHQVGLGPPLHGTFENGYVYGFTRGAVLDPPKMADAVMGLRIATHLGAFHRSDVAARVQASGEAACAEFDPARAACFDKIRLWLARVPAAEELTRGDASKLTDMEAKLRALDLDKVRKHVDLLEEATADCVSPETNVFSHNDLLCGNVLDDGGKAIHFIDFEYAGFNPRGFDIGNHFCEYAGYDCDFSRYPSRETQLPFLRAYLGPDASDADVDKLYAETCKFALAAHIFWGVWAIIQARFSAIDFDYLKYAGQRFDEAWRRWDEFIRV